MNQDFDYTPGNDQSFFTQGPNDAPSPTSPNGHANAYATASMWLGISAVVFGCCSCILYYLAAVLSIIAIVMSCLAKRDNNGKMPGKAIAGLILAIVGLIVFALILFMELSFMMLPAEEIRQLIEELILESTGLSFEEYIQYAFGQ